MIEDIDEYVRVGKAKRAILESDKTELLKLLNQQGAIQRKIFKIINRDDEKYQSKKAEVVYKLLQHKIIFDPKESNHRKCQSFGNFINSLSDNELFWLLIQAWGLLINREADRVFLQQSFDKSGDKNESTD